MQYFTISLKRWSDVSRDDSREFWVRAEDRNRSTAIKYNDLGLAEYAAIEAFKRYYF
jgi:glucosamine-6-phosphate deaminase